MEAFLGDWVVVAKFGYKGRIIAKHHNFKDTGEDQEWFEAHMNLLMLKLHGTQSSSILVVQFLLVQFLLVRTIL